MKKTHPKRARIRPPRLTAVKGNRQHWGRRLDKFRVAYDLSERDLVGVIDRAIGKSAIHDLLSGECLPRMEAVIKPLIATKIRQFLREKKRLNSVQIEREIIQIFNEPICGKEEEPVLTQRMILTKPAQGFFGLRFDPFTGDPRNRNEVFTTSKLDRIAGMLEDAIHYQGFIAVIGDVGSGKSLLKKRVVQTCIDSRGKLEILWPQFFNMEQVHSGSIASFVLRKFDQGVPRDRVYRAEKLRLYLASLAEEGIRVALGFDECHRLHPNLLTALKNFWELGSGGYDRYLGLILFGQPRFEMTLRSVDFREIAERLDSVRMPDLSKGDDAWKYVTHRLKFAGGSVDKIFDRAAIDSLTAVSATPLALGNLCNAALMKAFEFNQRRVTKDVLKALLGSEDGEPKVRAVSRRA